MKFSALRINSAPEVLVEEIISQIKSEKLKPGEVLPSQRELAKLFNVGLGSVREAIKVLDVKGYVNVVRGKGTYISDQIPGDKDEESHLENTLQAMSVAELLQAREIVESGAAKLAAAQAEKEDIKKLQLLGKAMDESFNDTHTFYKLDFEFHIAVAEATNNQAIIEIVKLLVNQAHDYISFMSDSLDIALPFTVERAVGTARKVIEKISAGDESGAEACMFEHLNIVNDKLDKEFLSNK